MTVSLMSTSSDILKSLVGVMDEHFASADVFQPRFLHLSDFTYINDEEADRADEILDENTIELTGRIYEKSIVRKFSAIGEEIPVCAVDAASAHLGETELGIVSAIRVAVIIQDRSDVSVEKFGPYIAHITEANKKTIVDFFERKVFQLKRTHRLPSLLKMTDRLRNYVERLAQRYASTRIGGGIVLWDGAIRETIDTPVPLIKKSISEAEGRKNRIVGVSKQTTIRLRSGEHILDLLERETEPRYININDKITPKLRRHFFGEIHVVKFTCDGFPFRVDVLPLPGEEACHTLNLLKSNICFYNGYPEPLRQAHINAYFTPNEVLALQNLAVDRYGMEIIRSFDVRRHILTPF